MAVPEAANAVAWRPRRVPGGVVAALVGGHAVADVLAAAGAPTRGGGDDGGGSDGGDDSDGNDSGDALPPPPPPLPSAVAVGRATRVALNKVSAAKFSTVTLVLDAVAARVASAADGLAVVTELAAALSDGELFLPVYARVAAWFCGTGPLSEPPRQRAPPLPPPAGEAAAAPAVGGGRGAPPRRRCCRRRRRRQGGECRASVRCCWPPCLQS